MAKELLKMCSHCGHSGHSSRACPDRGSVKLFGVRLIATNDGMACMRKSLSMGNLGHYRSLYNINHCSGTSECGSADQDGYLSDGLVHSSSNARERKKVGFYGCVIVDYNQHIIDLHGLGFDMVIEVEYLEFHGHFV